MVIAKTYNGMPRRKLLEGNLILFSVFVFFCFVLELYVDIAMQKKYTLIG